MYVASSSPFGGAEKISERLCWVATVVGNVTAARAGMQFTTGFVSSTG